MLYFGCLMTRLGPLGCIVWIESRRVFLIWFIREVIRSSLRAYTSVGRTGRGFVRFQLSCPLGRMGIRKWHGVTSFAAPPCWLTSTKKRTLIQELFFIQSLLLLRANSTRARRGANGQNIGPRKKNREA